MVPESTVKAGADAFTIMDPARLDARGHAEIARAVLESALAEGGIVTREQYDEKHDQLLECGAARLADGMAGDRIMAAHNRLAAENEKLREAIAFYADARNYRTGDVDVDDGDRARAALTREDNA